MPDLTVWPTDGADGSVSSEARWRKMARLWVPSGVTGPAGITPTLVAGPTINVAAGAAWLDGHYAELTGPASIPASANGLLVVRFTPADNHAELLYRDGAGLTPTQTDPTWELPIAQMVAGVMTDVRNLSTPNNPPVVTKLPAFPFDGQQVLFTMVQQSQAFHLVYQIGLGAPYRWRVVGGAPITVSDNNAVALAASAGYVDLTTPGPDVFPALAGVYRIGLGYTGAAAAASIAGMGCQLLPAASALGIGAVHNIAAAGTVTAMIEQDVNIPASALTFVMSGQPAATLRSRYYTASGNVTYSNRWLRAMPVLVG